MRPKASDREIGKLAGVDHKTVGTVRRGKQPAVKTSRKGGETRQVGKFPIRLKRALDTINGMGGRPPRLDRNTFEIPIKAAQARLTSLAKDMK